jgi:hypothetical protein
MPRTKRLAEGSLCRRIPFAAKNEDPAPISFAGPNLPGPNLLKGSYIGEPLQLSIRALGGRGQRRSIGQVSYGLTRSSPVRAATPRGTRTHPASLRKNVANVVGRSSSGSVLILISLSDGTHAAPMGTSTGRN